MEVDLAQFKRGVRSAVAYSKEKSAKGKS